MIGATIIRVDRDCSLYGIRRVDEPFLDWSVPFLVKIRITFLSITLRELKAFCITFDDFVGWAAHQTVFSVAYNSNPEMLVTLQTVETVVRTQRHRLDAETFPMFSVGWTWHGFCSDLNLCLQKNMNASRPSELF